MECPFCAESVKTEAIVCKHGSRDLRVARPVMLEIQEIVAELQSVIGHEAREQFRAATGQLPDKARDQVGDDQPGQPFDFSERGGDRRQRSGARPTGTISRGFGKLRTQDRPPLAVVRSP